MILLAHILAGFCPGIAAALLSEPIRLVVLELIGLSLGLFTVFGLAALIIRRLGHETVKRVTSPMDWIVLGLLAAQVLTGVGIALFARWGSRWYLDTAVPWMRSIFMFQPDPSTVLPLPGFIQFHMVNGFVLILLFPFTRLVHIITVPIPYLWRPYQLVIWNRRSQRRTGQEKAGL